VHDVVLRILVGISRGLISDDVLFLISSCHISKYVFFECKVTSFVRVNVEDRKKSFVLAAKYLIVLCTLPACQQTSAIVWWLYQHSLKSYEALLHIS
jgi:hypothetical protein